MGLLLSLDCNHSTARILPPVSFEVQTSKHSADLRAHAHYTNNLPNIIFWQFEKLKKWKETL